ncbi:MAG: NADAR family protein [Ruminococcus sp.]|nr:NADAR family protein [Ruminococcus sp.]
MKYNNEIIREQYSQGIKFEYIFFDSENPVTPENNKFTDEPIQKNFFGKNYDRMFKVDGQRFFSFAGYMMFNQAKISMQQSQHNFEAYRAMLGDVLKSKKGIKKYMKADKKLWSEQMHEVALKGNLEKFSQNLELKDYLISTGDKILVDVNAKDDVWGIGYSRGNIKNPYKWNGQNLLGFCLMEVRDMLRGESSDR